MGGADLKFRPQGSTYRNRLQQDPSESKHIINKMNHTQRERILQMEINKLMEKKPDPASLENVQKRIYSQQRVSSAVVQGSGSKDRNSTMRKNHKFDDKIEELRVIYTDFRPETPMRPSSRNAKGLMSPKSSATLNKVNIDVSTVLMNGATPSGGDYSIPAPSRKMDFEINRVA